MNVTMIFEKLHAHLSALIGGAEPVTIIGISGNMGAGKSYFGREFSKFLDKYGIHAVYWDQDWYQVSRAEREQTLHRLKIEGILDPLELSRRTFFDTYLWEEMSHHLTCMKSRQNIALSKVYNKSTGERDMPIELSFSKENKPMWIIYDGGFIMHKPIRSFMDCLIVVESNTEHRFERMVARALSLEKPYHYSRTRFNELDTFISWYLENHRAKTDIILDNNDLIHPEIQFPR